MKEGSTSDLGDSFAFDVILNMLFLSLDDDDDIRPFYVFEMSESSQGVTSNIGDGTTHAIHSILH